MPSALELQRLVVRLVTDASKWNSGFDAAEGRINKITRQATRMGSQLSLKVTAPLALVGAASVKAFSDFDDAMTKSTAIMDDVTTDIRKQMEAQAKTLSGKGVQSAKELAEAYFFLASAGLNAKQSMDALPVTQKFATAGAFDMALATDLLTDAQTAMGLASKDNVKNLKNLTRISDVFVKANTSANTSVQQVAEAITADAGTAAKQFGATLETTVAVLDAYASAGKKGAEAGNLFGRATRLLTDSHRKNGAVFEKYNIEVIDKATNEYRNFIDIIADMETAFKDMSKPQRDAALAQLGFKALAQKSITPLLGLSSAMKDYEAGLEKAGTTTATVSDKQMKSFASQMKVLKNQLEVVSIEVGSNLAPSLSVLNRVISAGLARWQRLSSGQKQVIVQLGLFVAAVGPATVVSAKLFKMGRRLVSVFGIMKNSLVKLIAQYIAHKKVAIANALEYAKQEAIYLKNAAAAKAHATSVSSSNALIVSSGTATTANIASQSRATIGSQRLVAASAHRTAGSFVSFSQSVSLSNARIAASTTAMSTTVRTQLALMIAAMTVAEAKWTGSQLRIAGATAASTAQTVGSMKLLTGATATAGRGMDIIDGHFTMATKSGGRFAGMLGKARGMTAGFGNMMRKGSAIAGAFKLELALLVGVIAFKLTTALSGANREYAKFNEEMAKANRLTSKQQGSQDRRVDRALQENAMKPLNQQKAGLEEILRLQEREKAGVLKFRDAAKKKYDELNTTFKSATGNKVLAAAKADMERRIAMAEALEARIQRVKDAIFDVSLQEKYSPQLEVEPTNPKNAQDVLSKWTALGRMAKEGFEKGMAMLGKSKGLKNASKYATKAWKVLTTPPKVKKSKDRFKPVVDDAKKAGDQIKQALQPFDAVEAGTKAALQRVQDHYQLLREQDITPELSPDQSKLLETANAAAQTVASAFNPLLGPLSESTAQPIETPEQVQAEQRSAPQTKNQHQINVEKLLGEISTNTQGDTDTIKIKFADI